MSTTNLISENSSITLSLVCMLVATVGSFAFFLTRFVTKSELEKVIDVWRGEFQRFEDKLDAVILREIDKHR